MKNRKVVTWCGLVMAAIAVTVPGDARSQSGPTQDQICKAAIGTLMSRNPKTIQVMSKAEGTTTLGYTRDDGTKWGFRCRLDGGRVVWATDTGRWRLLPEDDFITYRVEAARVVIQISYMDDSRTEAVYPLEAL